MGKLAMTFCRRLCTKNIAVFSQIKSDFRDNVSVMSVRRASSRRLSHSEHCLQMVRKYDYENFLSSLLLPKEARGAALAIRAWNIELAQIPDLVSQKNIGLMRFQFWKDSLELIYQGKPRETPVALELAKAIKKHNLTKRWFSRILEARVQNLSNRAYFNVDELEKYAEDTVSSTNYLILESLGQKDVNADHAASHLGKAQGIVTLLRGVPHHAARNNCFLPTEIMMQHNVSQEDVLRATVSQNVKDVMFEVASVANHHLELSRNMNDKVPKKARPAFLPSISVDSYLKSLQRSDFNVFDGRLHQRNNLLPLLMWLQKLKKSY